MSACMNQIVQFGPDRQFSGVLTGGADASGGLTLLLPSAGLQPRSGPFRLHVELGERLAASRIRTFRFDVPGVGEASRVKGFDSRATTIAAMDLLQTHYGCTRFAAGGICSAADLGWNAAVQDQRISALLLLDGISFTGPWFRYARMVDRLRRMPSEWRRMIRDARRRGGGGAGAPGSADFRDWPTHAEARQQFASLVSRDAHMLWIYTGGYTDRFLHPRQFRWTFGPASKSPRVVMDYWPDCDHTFFARDHRNRLIDRVTTWLIGLDQHAGAKS